MTGRTDPTATCAAAELLADLGRDVHARFPYVDKDPAAHGEHGGRDG